MRRWEIVFKALANINRLKIIRMLHKGEKMNVTEISDELKISFMGTSRHLNLLKTLGVFATEGRDGHVFYYLAPDMPKDFQKVIKIVL